MNNVSKLEEKSVKIGDTEYVLIPKQRWYQLHDIFTRMDTQLEILLKQVDYSNKLLERIATAKITVEAPINNRYWIFTVDLSEAHSDAPLGIMSEIQKKVNYAVVLQCDNPASWKRNSISGPSESLSVGYTVESFELSELYVTNSATLGELKVLVEWQEVE